MWSQRGAEAAHITQVPDFPERGRIAYLHIGDVSRGTAASPCNTPVARLADPPLRRSVGPEHRRTERTQAYQQRARPAIAIGQQARKTRGRYR